MLRLLLPIVAVLCGAACSCSAPKVAPALAANAPEPSAAGCARYAEPVASGTLREELPECSGLVASRRHLGVYWAHNDSGNALELIAIDRSGAVLARLQLAGPEPEDVEAIAVVPCGDGDCLVLADVGDNLRMRRQPRLYRVREPEPVPRAEPLGDVEVLAFTYPDGALNVEALLSDPRDGTLFLISKRMGTLGEVYRLEGLAPGKTGQATQVLALPRTTPRDEAVTGADAHPSGERILVRAAYVWEFRRAGAKTLEEVFQASPVQVPTGPLPQPEAVAYEADGRGYLLASEGAGSTFFRVGCADGRPAD